MAKIKYLLAILVLCSAAHAQEFNKYFPKTLNIVAVDGFLALSDAEVKQVYKKANYYFKKLGVSFRLKYIRDTDNPCSEFHKLDTWVDELKCLRRDAFARGLNTRPRMRQITYYMIPPWTTIGQDGTQTAWVGGVAFAICSDVAIGNATRQALNNGLLGESRLDHSAVVLAHEVGHLLCAHHSQARINLMHPDANRFTTAFEGKLPVLKFTIREIKKAWRKIRQLRKETHKTLR